MRRIVVATFTSLDGIMQAPGGPQEDPTGGFTLGGWTAPHFDAALGASMGEIFSRPFERRATAAAKRDATIPGTLASALGWLSRIVYVSAAALCAANGPRSEIAPALALRRKDARGCG